LIRCEEALRDDETEKAGLALEQAEKRATEDQADALADRLARCREDLDMVRELDAIDNFRWIVVESKFPDAKAVAARWRTAFAGHGVKPGETSPGEAADRVKGSIIRDRLLASLDLWLVKDPSPGVRALLRAADPDPYRDAVRDAIASRNRKQGAELAGRPAALVQPPGFAAALGQYGAAIPTERRRGILKAALLARSGNLSLLMALGSSYPINQREGADERLRWYQAAVAAHPRSVPAHNSLGIALGAKGDHDGAIAAYKEAIRLDSKFASAHNNLGATLKANVGSDAAIAAYREAIRLDPNNAAISHLNLGNALRDKKDLDGAIAAYREAIRLDPKYAHAHHRLMAALKAKGPRRIQRGHPPQTG